MFDNDSLYRSPSSSPLPSPPPKDPVAPGSQTSGLDEGKCKMNNTGSSSPSDRESKTGRSPEPEITGVLVVRPSQNDEGNGNEVDDNPAYPAALSPLPRSPSEKLPVDFTVLGEDSDSLDEEEPRPVLSAKDKGKWQGGEETPAHSPSKTVDEPPNTVDKDGYAMVYPDPEVEVVVVTTDEERAEVAKKAKLEEDAKDTYPIGHRIVAPIIASASAPVTSADPIFKEDIDDELDYDAEQPTTGIERAVQKRGSPRAFVIVRLIENTDKTGNNIKSAIRLGKHYFDADFGDFLLDISGPRTDTAQVRNYAGQERYIPRRMLQNIYQPWDIPAKTKVMDDGVPLPLMFLKEDMTPEEAGGSVAFENEEPVMVMDELDGNDDPREKGTKRKKDEEDDGENSQNDGDEGVGLIEKATVKKTEGKKKATATKNQKKGDTFVDDESMEDEVAEPSKTEIVTKSTGKKPAKKLKLDGIFQEPDEGPSETVERKRSAAKTTAAKTTTRKKPAGKKPAKKISEAKKTPKAKEEALLEEEESANEDVA
ncbi:hypothetical protein BKA65DRAFT_44490 [Rhexocercosporidium sp. MPI-PUGE-AT-0058]|nr:hypothetical protein BKA65DRAFT_44490 [Rhexocercosporidium sp. MPI-PUGE-AT-0058]